MQQQASDTTNGVPAGMDQALDLEGGEFLGDLWHTNLHIQKIELGWYALNFGDTTDRLLSQEKRGNWVLDDVC